MAKSTTSLRTGYHWVLMMQQALFWHPIKSNIFVQKFNMDYRTGDRVAKLIAWVASRYDNRLIKQTEQPYLVHLMAVAEVSNLYTKLGFESGLCHDMIEDGLTTTDALYTALTGFGYETEDIITIVQIAEELTEVFTGEAYPHLGKKKRKQFEAARLLLISAGAQTVKYADLLFNIDWMLTYKPAKAKKYLQRKQKLIKKLNKGNALLHQQVIQAISNGLIQMSQKELRL